MTWAACCDCGLAFHREDSETWKTRCIPCFKKSKRAEQQPDVYWLRRAEAAESLAADLRNQYNTLLAEFERIAGLERPRYTSSLDRELADNWRALVQLDHPDKHGGSVAANRITQWLNGIKGRLPCD